MTRNASAIGRKLSTTSPTFGQSLSPSPISVSRGHGSPCPLHHISQYACHRGRHKSRSGRHGFSSAGLYVPRRPIHLLAKAMVGERSRCIQRFLCFAGDTLEIGVHRTAKPCHRDLWLASEQGPAKFRFQPADAASQRRLRDAAATGGAREVQLFA